MTHGSNRQHSPDIDARLHKRILKSALRHAREGTNGESITERAARYRRYAQEAEISARNGPTLKHRYYYSAVAAEWRALADEVEASRAPRD